MTKYDLWYSSPTQVYWTCKALIEGRAITHKTEIRDVKGWRLAAITERLRKQFKWPKRPVSLISSSSTNATGVRPMTKAT